MATMSSLGPTRQPRRPAGAVCAFALILLLTILAPLRAQIITSLTTPLLLPTTIAYDALGNLYIAETDHHVIRRLSPTGVLTIVAGDTTQGFSGDNGPATTAQLDSPSGLVVDPSGNLYLADTHNHRIRKVAAATGIITTIAGTGTAGFSGDNGPAFAAVLDLPTALAIDTTGSLYFADTNNHRIRKITTAGIISTVAGNGLQQRSGDNGPAIAASIDTPTGLAIDSSNNLYLADTNNHSIRKVTAATGIITTLAGTGAPGFSGDNTPATTATLALPHGLTLDSGNLYFADTNNQRIRRIVPDGTITTLAGDGTQAFSGDDTGATTASLNTPRAVTLSSASLVTLADTGNQRIRQISAATTTGSTAAAPVTLTLSTAQTTYGSTVVTAQLATTGSVTGNVSLLEGASLLTTAPIAANVASLALSTLAAGHHTLTATYAGDTAHLAAQSAPLSLTVLPATVSASIVPQNLLYGQPIPTLAGSLTGVLPQDAVKLSLAVSSTAATLSPPGSYPITALLSGPAAGNYTLAPLNTALIISKAPTLTTLTPSTQNLAPSSPLTLAFHIASTTAGIPTGSVTLLDNTTSLAALTLSPTGDATFTTTTLIAGTHTLTALYSGDTNFASSTTRQPITVSIGTASDFSLVSTGANAQTILAGNAATFNFAVTFQGAALSSPIALTASGLATGTTATFSPTYLPPGGPTTFTLTLQTSKPSATAGFITPLAFLTLLLLPLASRCKQTIAATLCFGLALFATGCGDRITSEAQSTTATTTSSIIVTGTGTSPTGATLRHTATIILNVQ